MRMRAAPTTAPPQLRDVTSRRLARWCIVSPLCSADTHACFVSSTTVISDVNDCAVISPLSLRMFASASPRGLLVPGLVEWAGGCLRRVCSASVQRRARFFLAEPDNNRIYIVSAFFFLLSFFTISFSRSLLASFFFSHPFTYASSVDDNKTERLNRKLELSVFV